MARVVVTVGMGRWPFDRLVAAAGRLATDHGHEVFVQRGTSSITPPCAHADYLPPSELVARMGAADVVVTHAGNSVRLVQRLGRIPIAVGRRPDRGEMGNDHQLRYLAAEAAGGRVVVVEEPAIELASAVAAHAEIEARLLADRHPPPCAPEPDALAAHLDRLHGFTADESDTDPGPFADHPIRRYDWTWTRVVDATGSHLDVGCADGRFAGALAAARPDRLVVGVDPDSGSLERARARMTSPVLRIGIDDRLPFRNASFATVSVLDALEHVPDEHRLLSEVHRVLRPGGRVVITVPGRHLLSVLDPDNAKFRVPRFHRAVYRLRFGTDVYQKRFVDTSDGLVGDMSLGRHEHTNYRQRELVTLLEIAGFTPIEVDGANRWWRLFDTPALLGGRRLRAWCEQRILSDGRRYHYANLFCLAMKP